MSSSLLPHTVVGHIDTVIGAAAVMGHQGGWDEMLMVVVPVAAFAAMLYGANKRATRLARTEGDGKDEDGSPPSSRSDQIRNERGGPI